MRGSVIVPTWNAGDVLERCLTTIAEQSLEGGLETIVVDNASTDGTRRLLDTWKGRVHVISNERNAGFSAAGNAGAAVAQGEILFFLNADTELLAPDTLARLASVAQDPSVAIAGPMLVNPDGSLQPSCAAHPGIGRALLIATGAQRLLPDGARARVAPEAWSHEQSRATGWVKGAAMAMRAELFRELGGFWPADYAQEQDLALRAQRRGMCVRFERSARVMHIGNHSGSRRWSSPERAARIAGAELVFLEKHYTPARASIIRAIAVTGYALRVIAHSLLRHRERAAVFRSMVGVYLRGAPET